MLSGVYRPQRGRVVFDGADIIGRRPHQIAAAGMARTFQNVELFANLTVLDNLMLGRHTHLRYGTLAAIAWLRPGPAARSSPARAAVEDIVDFLELEQWRRLPVGLLPYGVQKRVELGRALAMEPKLLLLDEPVAGMNLEETEDMARYILDIRDELDIPIILVEHDMGLVMDLADRVMVVDFGVPIATGVPAEIQRDPDVIRAYLGEVQRHEYCDRSETGRPVARVATGGDHDRHPGAGPGAQHGRPGRHAREGLRHLAGGHLGGLLGHRAHRRRTPCSRSASSRATGSRSTRRTGASGSTPTSATVAVRAMTVGLYPTNPPAEVGYLLSHSGAKVLVAEDQEQVDKALAVLDAAAPTWSGSSTSSRAASGTATTTPKLLSWEDLLALGAEHRAAHPGAVEERMAAAHAGRHRHADLHLGHDRAAQGRDAVGVQCGVRGRDAGRRRRVHVAAARARDDLVLSYLPLCHVAERIFTTWFNAGAGVQVNFAESIATVQPNLREVQPTILFGVPRIWETILASVTIGLRNASPVKRRERASCGWRWRDRIGATLVRTGGRHTAATRLVYAIGWLFFYRALRERIGMRRVRYAASGAAPIAPEVLKFFMGIGVPMHEVYGMTENTAIATGNRPGRVKLGTVGEPQVGVELRIDPETGEILTRHPGTFVGYFRDPEATARTQDRRTAGCTPATSASGSTAPTCRSPTGPRTSSSRPAARTSRRARSRTR